MAAGAAIEFRRERAKLGGEDRIVAIHDRRLQPFEQRRVALAEQPQRLAQFPAAHVEIIGEELAVAPPVEALTRFVEAELPRLEALNEPDEAAGDVDELNGFFRRYALAA